MTSDFPVIGHSGVSVVVIVDSFVIHGGNCKGEIGPRRREIVTFAVCLVVEKEWCVVEFKKIGITVIN